MENENMLTEPANKGDSGIQMSDNNDEVSFIVIQK